eukprot:RCo039341
MSGTPEIFEGGSPLEDPVILLIVQMFVIIGLCRVIGVIVRPLRQPRVVAEIIGGILLGPSALGRIPGFTVTIFPSSSMTTLSTLANIGLIFFLFLVGLELDPGSLRQTGRYAMAVAIVGMAFPFGLGVATSYALYREMGVGSTSFGLFTLFNGVAMCITAFPVLARILTERKLTATKLGQITMSAAAVNDVAAWVLLALVVALLKAGSSPIVALYTFLCAAAFVALMFFPVRPLIARGVARFSGYDHIAESVVLGIFLLVLGSAVFTEMIGIHAIFGAFVAGLVLPKESGFTHALTEKLEDFIVHLILPCYFAISGIKTQIAALDSGLAAGMLVLVIATACLGKITGSFITARCIGMDTRNALTLSVLMNTKGLVELIVLNIGLSTGVITVQIFTI